MWSGVKVALWLSHKVGRPVPRQRESEALRALSDSCQKPRPCHVLADVGKQEAFKKLAACVEDERGRVVERGDRVQVWASDEHRIGLRRVVQTGKRPIVESNIVISGATCMALCGRARARLLSS